MHQGVKHETTTEKHYSFIVRHSIHSGLFRNPAWRISRNRRIYEKGNNHTPSSYDNLIYRRLHPIHSICF